MQKVLIISLFASSLATASVDLTYSKNLSDFRTYQQQAEDWVITYMQDASLVEYQCIANLLYLSWLRSHHNIETQQAIISALEEFEKSLNLFDRTRMNPGIFGKTHEAYHSSALDHLTPFLITHEHIGKKYTHAVNTIVDGSSIKSVLVKTGVNDLRENARIAVTRALGSAIGEIHNLTHNAHTLMKNAAHTFAGCSFLSPSRTVIEEITHYLSSLLIPSLAQADKAYTQAVADCMKAITFSHEVHAALWKLMEEVRKAYYYAHYQAIYEVMLAKNIPSSLFTELFDENGFRSIGNLYVDDLPDPKSLL